jgi:hypothetical protein
VPAERRKAVSRTAGWISPVVVHQGRVVGVWELTETTVDVRLFPEADLPRDALEAEVGHLAACTGQPLSLAVGAA